MTAVTPGSAELLAKAAQDFIDKVDRGEAKSTKSYAAFKAALAAKPDEEVRVEAYRECADIATRYNDCGGNFIAEKIRDAASALPTKGKPKP